MGMNVQGFGDVVTVIKRLNVRT